MAASEIRANGMARHGSDQLKPVRLVYACRGAVLLCGVCGGCVHWGQLDSARGFGTLFIADHFLSKVVRPGWWSNVGSRNSHIGEWRASQASIF